MNIKVNEFCPNKIKFGLISKSIISLTIFNYVASFINKNYSLVFSNIPLFTLYHFEIFRFITSIFIADNLYELFLNFCIIYTIFNFWENKDGTAKFIIKLFILNLFVFQIPILFLYFILHFLFPIVFIYKIKIIPSIGMAYLIKYVLSTETKKLFLINDKKINDRLLIFLYMIGIIILNGLKIKIEFILSFYFGFLICKYPKIFNASFLNEETILHFEKNEKFLFLVGITGYIPIDESYIGNVSSSNNNNIPIPQEENKENNENSDKELNQNQNEIDQDEQQIINSVTI